MNRYYNPVRVYQGPKSIQKIPQLLGEMDLSKGNILLLAYDAGVFDLSPFRSLAENHPDLCLCRICFKESNPTVEQLYQVFKSTAAFCPDVVIAVGGGSILDVGKSLCCLYGKEIPDAGSLRDYIAKKEYGIPRTRWIGVPTTAGTGSEVTCWATIWDPKQNAKRSVESTQNYAYAAVVDPDLTAGMPVGLALSSALDAVAHAAESYWAKATNDISRTLALRAIGTIMRSIDSLVHGDPRARERMSLGSLLAGLAFSNTKTTACHSISYPLTMHYAIPHGVAVSLLLAPVMRLNQPVIHRYPDLLQALGVADADALEERIHALLRLAGIPATLREWGIPKEKLPSLAGLGLTKGRADNNPAELNAGIIQSILETIYETKGV